MLNSHWYWHSCGCLVGKRKGEPGVELCRETHLRLSRRMFPTNSYRWRFGLSHSIRPERRIRLSMSFMSAVTWRPCWCSYSSITAVSVFLLFYLQKIPLISHCMYSVKKNKERIQVIHLSDFKVCFSVQVRCFNVAHSLWFTVVEEEDINTWGSSKLLFNHKLQSN